MSVGNALVRGNNSLCAEHAVVTRPPIPWHNATTQQEFAQHSSRSISAPAALNSSRASNLIGILKSWSPLSGEDANRGLKNIDTYSLTLSMSAFVVEQMSALSFKVIDSNSTELAESVLRPITLMVQATSILYRDIISRCKEIIESLQVDDVESRDIISERLVDILQPFRSFSQFIFRNLIDWKKDDADLISFILGDVMLRSEFITDEQRVDLILRALENSRASVRLAAIEALDRLGTTDAQRILTSIYPNESRLAKDLITASLNHAR